MSAEQTRPPAPGPRVTNYLAEQIADNPALTGRIAADIATHEADTTAVHGIADTSTLYRAGGTDVAIADGGTGASTAAGARTALGLDSPATIGGTVLRSAGTSLALGSSAQANLTSGSQNIALGSSAQANLASGSQNIALGSSAQYWLVGGDFNVAVGHAAQLSATSGHSNTALGVEVERLLTTGTHNVAVGAYAQYWCGATPTVANATTTGTAQTCVGAESGQNSATQRTGITVVGRRSAADGDYATALGHQAVAGAAGSVAIGTNSAGVGASTATANQIVLGTSSHSVLLPAAGLGFFGATPTAKPTITGSRGGNAAIASLLAALATLGLLTDSTTA